MKTKIYGKMRKEQLVLKRDYLNKKDKRMKERIEDLIIKKIKLEVRIRDMKWDHEKVKNTIGKVTPGIQILNKYNADRTGTDETGLLVIEKNGKWYYITLNDYDLPTLKEVD